MIRRIFVVLFAAVAVAISPTTATAYTPVAPDGGTVSVTPGVSTVVPFSGFREGPVDFTLEGEDAESATLAGVQTFVKDADAEGKVEVIVTLPADADGRYLLTGVQEGSAPVTVTLDTGVVAGGTDGTLGGGGATAADASTELPTTGAAENSGVIVVAVGLLVAGASAVLWAGRRRAKV